MIFVSKHERLMVVLRPTIKQVVNNKSGSEETIKHSPIVVDFRGGIFDTTRWPEFVRPESPDKFNIIQSEDDLIKHLKANDFFGQDFTEMKVETKQEKRARLMAELNALDGGEETNPENGQTITTPGRKRGPKGKGKGKGKSASVVDL